MVARRVCDAAAGTRALFSFVVGAFDAARGATLRIVVATRTNRQKQRQYASTCQCNASSKVEPRLKPQLCQWPNRVPEPLRSWR